MRRLRRLLEGERRSSHVVENGQQRFNLIELKAYGPLKRDEGNFHLYLFEIDDEWREYQAIVKADIDRETLLPKFHAREPIFLRIDSGCSTGQVLHDKTCDCREQLNLAVGMLSKYQEGLIIRIPFQDGRGMGQAFKLATMVLHDQYRLDTVRAAETLSLDGMIDRRTYSGAISLLSFLNVPKIGELHLGTNNPLKEGVLSENGYRLGRTVAVHAPRTEANEQNLEAKKKLLGHRL